MNDYEEIEITRGFIMKTRPVNLHAICLQLKCFNKVLSMLREHLIGCMVRYGLPSDVVDSLFCEESKQEPTRPIERPDEVQPLRESDIKYVYV